jgi:hypothetical protein
VLIGAHQYLVGKVRLWRVRICAEHREKNFITLARLTTARKKSPPILAAIRSRTPRTLSAESGWSGRALVDSNLNPTETSVAVELRPLENRIFGRSI